MEILWNQINLRRPPFRSWDVSLKEFDPKQFTDTIDCILNEFETLKVLNLEAALLSRLIYRMKSKFRSDTGLKHMEKINRALLNYLNISIEREYEVLKENIEINNEVVSMPPQQCLEFLLVKTQGFAKLMCRIESTAISAGKILQSRFYTGQSWSIAIIAYGVVSRIWKLSRYLIRRTCVWYKKIYQFLKFFKSVGIPWLPENYELPADLLKWLDLSWLHKVSESSIIEEHFEKSAVNLISGTHDTTKNKNNVEDRLKFENISTVNNSSNVQSDFGQRISRVNFEKNDKNLIEKKNLIAKLNKKKVDKKLLLKICTEKDLVKILKAESYPGFDKLLWNQLKKRIKKLLMKLTKNNTCDLTKKKLKKINTKVKMWTENLQ